MSLSGSKLHIGIQNRQDLHQTYAQTRAFCGTASSYAPCRIMYCKSGTWMNKDEDNRNITGLGHGTMIDMRGL